MTDSSTIAPATPAAPKRAAIAFIFVTVVLDVLAMGVIIPIFPELVKDFLGGDPERASRMYGLFATVWALMQVIWSPIMGVLSDRYGRRRVILLSNFGLGFDYLLMALAPSLGWLFVGRVVSGITGASFSAAGAYIADVSPPEKRAASYGILGAAFGLGFMLGPAMGGILGQHNVRLPFFVAAGLTLVNALYGLFVLPESLAEEHRKPFSWKRASPMGSLRLLRSHPELLGLAAVVMLYFTAHQVFQSVYVFYTNYRYGWGPMSIGLTLALIGVLSMTVQGLLVKPAVARFGERRTLIAGLSFGVVGMSLFGLAPTGVLFLSWMPVVMLMGFVSPSTQGLMSRRIGPSEQGQLQGAITSLMALTGLWGPTLYTTTFALAIGRFGSWRQPGAPFFVSALMLTSALIVAVRVTRARAAATTEAALVAPIMDDEPAFGPAASEPE